MYYEIWWTSADGQGTLPMGYSESWEDASDFIPWAREDMLAQAGDDLQAAWIDAGVFEIEAVDETSTDQMPIPPRDEWGKSDI